MTTVSGINSTSYTPDIPLDDDTSYYWRVKAIDALGEESAFQTMHFVFTVETGYLPPSYIGGINSAVVKWGDTWSVDLDDCFQVGSVTLGLVFSCNYEDVQIDPETHIATWSPKDKSSSLSNLIFTVSDGTTEVASFPIDLTVEVPVAPLSFWERIYWPWMLLPFIFVILFATAIAFKRRKYRPIVEEVFLIYEDGCLITHASVRVEEDIDEDILSSMLTGVKDLISDAFVRDKEGKEEKGLHKLEFGDRNIMLERGNSFFIAIVFTGQENKGLLSKNRKTIESIEERYKNVLGKWNGDVEAFKGVDEIIALMLSLKESSDLEKTKEEEKKDKILKEWEKSHEKIQKRVLPPPPPPELLEENLDRDPK